MRKKGPKKAEDHGKSKVKEEKVKQKGKKKGKI